MSFVGVVGVFSKRKMMMIMAVLSNQLFNVSRFYNILKFHRYY